MAFLSRLLKSRKRRLMVLVVLALAVPRIGSVALEIHSGKALCGSDLGRGVVLDLLFAARALFAWVSSSASAHLDL